MRIKYALLAAALLATATLFPTTAKADFPQHVFAPYMYIGQGDNFKLTDCNDACGLKFYTLAFIIAKQDSTPNPDNPKKPNYTYSKVPSWDGHNLMAENLYKEQIDAIRQRGGDVIMSFGGEAGKEMANVIDNEADLEAAYQSVIDTYKFTWLDFDVEGNNLDKGKADSERRNSVLASLQKKNPGLIISYTLPVDPHGLSEESQDLLKDAVKKGVKVHSANIMVMYFGKQFIGKGKSEGELGIDSAKITHDQLQAIDPSIQIGLCPCLGRNGSSAEVFDLEDAKTLKAFADQTPYICSLHYWSINDDAAKPRKRKATTQPVTEGTAAQPQKNPWDFARIFEPFTK
jgi:chitinase